MKRHLQAVVGVLVTFCKVGLAIVGWPVLATARELQARSVRESRR